MGHQPEQHDTVHGVVVGNDAAFTFEKETLVYVYNCVQSCQLYTFTAVWFSSEPDGFFIKRDGNFLYELTFTKQILLA